MLDVWITEKCDPNSRQKAVFRHPTDIRSKNVKAVIIIMLRKYAHNEWTNRKSQDEKRNYIKEYWTEILQLKNISKIKIHWVSLTAY